LSNTGKFTHEGGSITLSVDKISGNGNISTLHFTVTDTGIGIAPGQQDRLFSLFEQADGGIARRYTAPAISKSMVELMGGEIWMDSELGKGSRFIFELTVQEGSSVNPSAAVVTSGNTASVPATQRVSSFPTEEEAVEINQEILIALLKETSVAIDCARTASRLSRCSRKTPENTANRHDH
jgi:hypothetical protein